MSDWHRRIGKNCHELWQRVSRYTTKLVELLPAELQGALPSPRETRGGASIAAAESSVFLRPDGGMSMSIYATLWTLRFPRFGQYYVDCDWVTVVAQGVLGHVGVSASIESGLRA